MIVRPPLPPRPIASFPSRSFFSTEPAIADARSVVGYRYRFTISGTELAVAAATLRIRNTDASDCYLTLAGVPSIDLSALIGDEIVFTVIEQLNDLSLRETELFMFYFRKTDISETINDYVVDISGDRKLTYGNPQTVTISKVLLQSWSNVTQRWRIGMRKDLKPGDTVVFDGGSLNIKQLSYFLGINDSYIELSDG